MRNISGCLFQYHIICVVGKSSRTINGHVFPSAFPSVTHNSLPDPLLASSIVNVLISESILPPNEPDSKVCPATTTLTFDLPKFSLMYSPLFLHLGEIAALPRRHSVSTYIH